MILMVIFYFTYSTQLRFFIIYTYYLIPKLLKTHQPHEVRQQCLLSLENGPAVDAAVEGRRPPPKLDEKGPKGEKCQL